MLPLAELRDRLPGLVGVGPWHEVLYGVDFGPPHDVDSGLAGVRERLR